MNLKNLRMFRMKRGTKIGWLLVAVAVLLSIWVLIGQRSDAANYNGFEYEKVNGNIIIVKYDGEKTQLVPGDFPEGGTNVITIRANAFANTNVKEVALPTTVTTIEAGAFFNCKELTSVSISGLLGLIEIPDDCFNGCEKLINVSLPQHIRTIGNRAFMNCRSLEVFTIREDLAKIGDDAFLGCDSLIKFANQEGEMNAYFSVFGRLNWLYSGNKLTSVPASSIPAGTTSISASDFDANCTTIGAGAFSSLTENHELGSITIPDSVTYIEDGAFDNSNIAVIYLPKTITYVGAQNWDSLGTVYGYYDASHTAARDFALLKMGVNFIDLGETGEGGGNGGGTNNPGTGGNGGNGNTGGNTPGNQDQPNNPGNTNNNNNNNNNTNNNTNNSNIPNVYSNPGSTTVIPPTIPYIGQSELEDDTAASTNPQTNQATGGDSQAPVTNGGSNGAATSNGKDATPKTADGDLDPRWLLIIGVFLIGMGVIFYSRMRKWQYVSTKKDSDLDS